MNRTKLVQEDAALRQERAEAYERINAIDERLREIEQALRVPANIAPDVLVQAARTMRVSGDPSVNRSVIRDALADLANGAPRLRREYFGAKQYDRWSGQREDHCYGQGPRHGHIVHSVGLRSRKNELTPEEIEAAIVALVAIRDGMLRGSDLEAVYRETRGEA